MTKAIRQGILRANAIFLLVAATSGFLTDVLGIFFSVGAQAPIIGSAPNAGIGFIEAHGLAFIIGILLWRAAPVRSWHLTAAGVHVLLGVSNLVFWPIFVAADALWAGYVTTTLHWSFVALQLIAASSVGANAVAPARA